MNEGNNNTCNACHACSHCGCPHHKFIPALVVLFGLLFLLNALGIVTAEFTGIAWPVLVLLAGLVKLMVGGCKCYSK